METATIDSEPFSLEVLLTTISTIVSATNISPVNEIFHNSRYQLYEFGTKQCSEVMLQRYLNHPVVLRNKERIFEICARAGELEESLIATELLALPTVALQQVYKRYYGDIYESLLRDEMKILEAAGVDLRNERIAYIGSGAMPVPSLLLADMVGAEVTCIEQHGHCCELARRIVCACGYAETVSIENTRAEDFDFSGYSVVFFANWLFRHYESVASLQRFSSVKHLVMRSAAPQTVSPLINYQIDKDQVRACGFEFQSESKRQPHNSLHSLYFTRDEDD